MDKEQLKEVFLKRLCIEYKLFEDSMLRKEKTDIFEESYRIEIYKNLYQILVHEAAEMAETVFRRLVYQSYGIMEFFYQEWLKKEDSSHNELSVYVSSELEDYYMEAEQEMKAERKTELETEIEETAREKEGAYGKEHSKAS